jgi:FkbM family methyltransferase
MNLRQLVPPALKRMLKRLREQPTDGAPPPTNAEMLRAAADQPSKYVIRTLENSPDDPTARNDRLIIDLGMHIGQDTDFYLRKGFDVVAIEANPILAADAEQRFKEPLRDGRLKILNVGIGEKRGRVDFHVNLELSEWSSFVKSPASRGMPTAAVNVEMVTIGDVIRKFGTPYYLKIDIEGLDGAAVLGLADCPTKPRFVSFENGELSLFETLTKFGYAGFKFINQADVPSFICPTPAREGETIAYTFVYGASGPFGEDTPGEWLDADAMRPILERHAAARASGKYDAVRDGWFDLHARLH